jgi:hypothetical protein
MTMPANVGGLAPQGAGGLMVFSDFVVEGMVRRHGEILPLEGNVSGVINAQYAQYVSKEQMRATVVCVEKGCGRKFIDQGTMEAHVSSVHSPESQAMREALAKSAGPEPGPSDDAGSRADASNILPVGVTGTQQLAGTGESYGDGEDEEV